MNSMMKRRTLMAAALTLLLMLVMGPVSVQAEGTLSGGGTQSNPYRIGSTADWNTFAENVNGGTSYEGQYVQLENSISNVTATVGTQQNPFKGTFLGNSKKLILNIEDTSAEGTAPFRYISGATIKNLTIDGSVKGGYHAAGIVGFAWAGTNTIEDCKVQYSASIEGNYTGGIVGHGKRSTLVLKNVVFSGKLSCTNYAGGLLGWSDGSTLTIDNCFVDGKFNGTGSFAAIAARNGNASMDTSVTKCYYKDKLTPTADEAHTAAAGIMVSERKPSDQLYQQVLAADGFYYYTSEGGEISGVDAFYVYTGEPITVEPVVTFQGEKLQKDVDYSIVFKRSGVTQDQVQAAGDYTIEVTGIGDYRGTSSITFSVKQPESITNWDNLMNGMLKGGVFRLDKDIFEGGHVVRNLKVPEGKKVFLDLNGHTVDKQMSHTFDMGVVFLVDGGELTISDSSGTNAGKITGGKNQYRSDSSYGKCDGGGVCVQNGGTFTLNGGTITGNETDVYPLEYYATGVGGGVYVGYQSTFIMNGGIIEKNKAKDNGGGVYVSNDSNFIMNGGEIRNNTATNGNGGGVMVRSSRMTLNDGSIKNNVSKKAGGGIYAIPYSGDLEFNLNGGTINGNRTTDGSGGGLYIYSSSPDSFHLSGKPVITGNYRGTGENEMPQNAYIGNLTINVNGPLTEGASIGITSEKTPGQNRPAVFTSGLAAEDATRFFSNDSLQYILGTSSSGEAQLEALSTWAQVQAALRAGYSVKLENDIPCNDQTLGPLEIPEGKNVTLNLNGHVLDRKLSEPADNGEAILVKGSLTLSDSNPSIVHSGGLTGGILTGGSNLSDGGGILIDGGTLNLTGGTIAQNWTEGNGGGVFIADGSINISGSPLVTGNEKSSGSRGVENNVYLPSGKVFTVTGNLGANARIGVTTQKKPGDETPVVLTSGLSGKGTEAAFVSDDDFYESVLKDEEAALQVRKVDVYVVMQNADGTWTQPEETSGQTAVNKPYSLPSKNNFTAAGYSTSYTTPDAQGQGSGIYIITSSIIPVPGSAQSLWIYYTRNKYDLNLYADTAGRNVQRTVKVYYEAPLPAAEITDPERTGYTFEGWSKTPVEADAYDYHDVEANKLDLTAETMPGKAMNIYPMFVQERLRVYLDLGAYDGNAGEFTDSQGNVKDNYANWSGKDRPEYTDAGSPVDLAASQYRCFTTDSGEKIVMDGSLNDPNEGGLNDATREGYELFGWVTADGTIWDQSYGTGRAFADGPELIRDETHPYSYYCITLTAKWAGEAGSYFEEDSNETGNYKITLLLNDGVSQPKVFSGSVEDTSSVTIPNPTREGFDFTGWSTEDNTLILSSEGETTIITKDIPGGEVTLSALWSASENEKYTVELDPAGGTLPEGAESTITGLIPGSQILSLPVPTRSGYIFSGWYIGDTDEQVPPYTQNANQASKTTVFTAHWTERPPSGGTGYKVNVPEETDQGSVTVKPKKASKGTTVVITPDPKDGYDVDEVKVTDKNGNPVDVKDNGDGTYSFVMPNGPVNVDVTFKEKDHEAVCPAKKFTDVDITQWYHLDLDYVLNEGMMNGTSDTTFDPQGTTNRAMIVTILYRLEGEPEAAEAPFTDLTQDWYKAAVGWAAENGIVKGMSETVFAPNDPITREQFATILYRYAEYKKVDVSGSADLSKYEDNGQIHDYAKESMAWANAAGLITGVTETTLEPVGNATRAQAAAIFHRFCENVAGAAEAGGGTEG